MIEITLQKITNWEKKKEPGLCNLLMGEIELWYFVDLYVWDFENCLTTLFLCDLIHSFFDSCMSCASEKKHFESCFSAIT